MTNIKEKVIACVDYNKLIIKLYLDGTAYVKVTIRNLPDRNNIFEYHTHKEIGAAIGEIYSQYRERVLKAVEFAKSNPLSRNRYKVGLSGGCVLVEIYLRKRAKLEEEIVLDELCDDIQGDINEVLRDVILESQGRIEEDVYDSVAKFIK